MKILLSASVPLPDRDAIFFETADVLAIREAIKSLVEFVLLRGRITFGGHPAITPLISLYVRHSGQQLDRVQVFQSDFFRSALPKENDAFVRIRITPAVGNSRDRSLTRMRREMIASEDFDAMVIIGGMEGIYEEVSIFRTLHSTKPIFPIASTGAAARILFSEGDFEPQLLAELTYPTLFRRLFSTWK